LSSDIFYTIILVLIVLTSGLLWLQGSDWGHPYAFHSDELRYLTRTINDPASPVWTIYGRWPIYLVLAASGLTDIPASSITFARKLSTLISLVGLVAAALAARRLSGWAGAIVAASLLAGAPVVVQSAHFFIADVLLSTGVSVSILFAFRIVQRECGGWLDTLGMGVSWGIAMGSKPSGLFLLPGIALAYFLSRVPGRMGRLTTTCSVAVVLALLGQPTLLVHGLRAFLHEGQFLHHLGVAAGTYLPPYTLQFENTPAWTYYFTHLLWWGAGPPLTLLGCLGGIVALIHLVQGWRQWQVEYHLGTTAVTCAVFGTFYLMSAGQRDKFTRYVLPLLPSLAILGSWFLVNLTKRLSVWLRSLILVAFVLVDLVPGVMYTRIYRHLDTRLQAATWVERNIPARSSICHEPDLGFAVPPIGLGGPSYGNTGSLEYQGTLLDWGLLYWASDYVRQNQSAPVVETSEMQSVRSQAQQQLRVNSWLATCDWIILSDRFADQFMPLSDEFEAIGTFYNDLLSNRHSEFHRVAEFRSLPGILGFTVDDSRSELTFRSFDHPTIWIFRRY
jgi:4-amino-4-deoxy-L-arabinose transferase-like glycosyltransferase